MLSISTKVTQKKPNFLEKVLERAKDWTEHGVAAGFPRGKLNAPHYDNGASIIDVAIWNNYGFGVPQRDFMTPASKKWKKHFTTVLDMVKDGINKGTIEPDKFLAAMGVKGSKIIRQEIIDLDTPPNAPSTIKRKGSSNPLVDTGAMANSATWVLRKANKE